jgi:hypothetical protein
MRLFISSITFLVLLLAGTAQAQGLFNQESADRKSGYSGGGGLITYYGQTGMFLNPTSGTKHANDFSLQSCALVFKILGERVVAHALLATYGVTDWLEIGVFGLGVYGTPGAPIGAAAGPGPGPGPGGPGIGGAAGLAGADSVMGAGQANVRARLIKDEGFIPEVSVGAMVREGHEYLRQQSVYIAGSKGIPLGENSPISEIRFHAGFKQIWQDDDVKESDGSIPYGGIDISMPLNLHLVAEVSAKDDIYLKTPFSVGVQWRDPRGYGASLAFVRSDDWGANSVYIGVGINF